MSRKLDLWSDKGFPEVQNRGFTEDQDGGQVDNERGNQGQYSNLRISYKTKRTKSLYIWGHSHSISQGKQKCDRCKDRDKQSVSEKHNKVKHT